MSKWRMGGRRSLSASIVGAAAGIVCLISYIPAFAHATTGQVSGLVWQSVSSHNDEIVVFTPSLAHRWFGTEDNPVMYLGTWDGPDFVTTASTTVPLWARSLSSGGNILDVGLAASSGGDPYYGTTTPTSTVDLIYGYPYTVFVYVPISSTSTLQEVVLQTRVGSHIHHGDELWTFLYPSTDNHAVGGTGSMVQLQICEVPCEATPLPPPEPVGCTENCFSNVLFLPGIEGSRLYRPDGEDGTEKLWEPSGDNDVRDLYLSENGEGLREDVYAKAGDIVDEMPGGLNVYKSFMAKMDELKSAGTINDWEPIAYDWRLSLDDLLTHGRQIGDRLYYTGELRATSTPYIIEELRRLAASSKTGKVTIIPHSNGGVLAKRLTETLGPEASQLIDKMIFVAVPQTGAPEAVYIGMHGQKVGPGGIAASRSVTRPFASTSPMFYHLLPSSA